MIDNPARDLQVSCLVDGLPTETIPVFDSSVLRGDGCFEAVRSYSGQIFALDWHLDRLGRSAELMSLPLPDRAQLTAWCRSVTDGSDQMVRLVVTRGDAVAGYDAGCRVIVFTHRLPPRLDSLRLRSVTAPWHPAGRWSELAGAKTLSYAPNVAATRVATAAGYDDAVLIDADDKTVLEGPTFTMAWVIDGHLETPALDLHILDSITRRTVLEEATAAGLDVCEVDAPLEQLLRADEAMALSTVKEVTPVVTIDDVSYPKGVWSAVLGNRFKARVAQDGQTPAD